MPANDLQAENSELYSYVQNRYTNTSRHNFSWVALATWRAMQLVQDPSEPPTSSAVAKPAKDY